ncbi:MAG: GHKL domain-containing protein [Hahellaceae bacterium]|nr:GHKL domain-containing protein [Hahellaceae bacterium]
MPITSIQDRLALWLSGSVIVLLCIHLWITRQAPARFEEDYLTRQLEQETQWIGESLSIAPDGQLSLAQNTLAPVYFHALSGHYFQLTTPTQTLTSASLGEFRLLLPEAAPASRNSVVVTQRIPGPAQQELLARMEMLDFQGQSVQLIVAQTTDVLTEHVNRFRLRFTLITLGLFILLISAQRWIIRRSLQPLEKLQTDCKALETGDLSQISENLPREIKPLAAEINRLNALMINRIQRSRNALGNLAHGLKTPLALLSQLSRQADASALHKTQAVEAIARIQSLIDRELKRARLAGTHTASQRFRFPEDANDLLAMFRQIHQETSLKFSAVFPTEAIRYGDKEDLFELLGNLLDNASKWARQNVQLTVGQTATSLRLQIEDDGSGIPDGQRDQLTQRGLRLDEQVEGHGLGMSIVQDIVEHYGGTITIDQSPMLRGARISINLPR